MAYIYIWPSTLPQKPKTDYSESSGALILRTSMDSGPAKMRRRGQRPDNLSVTYMLSSEQVSTLETFVKDSLKGTTRFGYPHPRLETVVEARIVPQQDGGLYSINYVLPDLWSVSLTLEILP